MTVHGLHILDYTAPWPVVRPRAVRLWDCGVTWRHLHLAPDVIDWAPLDRVVDVARANGATDLLYVIAATPQWAARDPHAAHAAPWLGAGSNSPPASPGPFTSFVAALASRYAGRIGTYQVWNEPQLQDFWAGDMTTLADLTKRAARIIRDRDPRARIASAPVLPRPSSGGMKRGSKYLTALGKAGWPIDIHTAHLYPEIGTGAQRWRWMLDEWAGGLRSVKAPHLPRWVTETNMNLLGGPLPDPTQLLAVTRIGRIADARGIARVYWYAWQHADPTLLGVPFTPTSVGTRALTRLTHTQETR